MIVDYLSLRQTVAKYIHRNDLDDMFDIFMQSATVRINQSLRCSEMEARANTVISKNFVMLPEDCLEIRTVQIGDRGPMRFNTLQELDYDSGQTPKFSIFDNQLEIRPEVPDDTEIEIVYYAGVSPLVEDTDSNCIMDKYPFVYLYACMLEATLYIQDDVRIQIWMEALVRKFDTINGRTRDRQYAGAPMKVEAR